MFQTRKEVSTALTRCTPTRLGTDREHYPSKLRHSRSQSPCVLVVGDGVGSGLQTSPSLRFPVISGGLAHQHEWRLHLKSEHVPQLCIASISIHLGTITRKKIPTPGRDKTSQRSSNYRRNACIITQLFSLANGFLLCANHAPLS